MTTEFENCLIALGSISSFLPAGEIGENIDTIFILINAPSLINAPTHFYGRKSGRMTLKLAKDIRFSNTLPTVCLRNVVLGLIYCSAPGAFIRINTVSALTGT